jgi:hypothetical protein
MTAAARFIGLPVLCILIVHPSGLRADGGAMRLSERVGGYRVTVFTDPTPLRAGPVDFSVFVQDADTGEPAAGVRIMVQAAPRGRPGEAIGHAATAEAATNKLFQSAIFELSEAGWWDIEATVDGEQGQARLRFDVEAADHPPSWQAMAPWVGWPALAVLLFAVHQSLVRRKARVVKKTRTKTIPTGDVDVGGACAHQLV